MFPDYSKPWSDRDAPRVVETPNWRLEREIHILYVNVYEHSLIKTESVQ